MSSIAGFEASWRPFAEAPAPFGAFTAGGKGDPCTPERPCKPLDGPTTLFAKGAGDADAVDLNDIKQGGLADCYFMSSLGALARQNPDAIRNMIRDNGDGTYTVTFYKPNHDAGSGFGLWGPDYKACEITVDGNLPDSNNAAHASGDVEGGKAEIWPQIIEKAYAEFRGDYGDINTGGTGEEAMEALTGRDATSIDAGEYGFEQLQTDLRDGKTVTVTTPNTKQGKTEDGNTLGYGLHDWHGYVVVGTQTDPDGKRYVILHNPWGSDHPQRVPFEEFGSDITGVTVGSPP